MLMLAFSSNLVMHHSFMFRLYTEIYSTNPDYYLFAVKRILSVPDWRLDYILHWTRQHSLNGIVIIVVSDGTAVTCQHVRLRPARPGPDRASF